MTISFLDFAESSWLRASKFSNKTGGLPWQRHSRSTRRNTWSACTTRTLAEVARPRKLWTSPKIVRRLVRSDGLSYFSHEQRVGASFRLLVPTKARSTLARTSISSWRSSLVRCVPLHVMILSARRRMSLASQSCSSANLSSRKFLHEGRPGVVAPPKGSPQAIAWGPFTISNLKSSIMGI